MKLNAPSTNRLVAVAVGFGFVMFVVGFLVAGCASVGVKGQAVPATADRPEPGKGLVIFYRESQFAGGGVPFSIFEVNTQPPTKIVVLSNGRYFAYSVTPGNHRFVGTKSATLPSFNFYEGTIDKMTVTDVYFCDMNIESNTTYYAHAELVHGGLITNAKLSVVDTQQGSEAIKNLRRAALSH
jgi:hypothetical protein